MNARISLITSNKLPATLSIVDGAVYVDPFISILLEKIGCRDKAYGNEACLTDDECRSLIHIFIEA